MLINRHEIVIRIFQPDIDGSREPGVDDDSHEGPFRSAPLPPGLDYDGMLRDGGRPGVLDLSALENAIQTLVGRIEKLERERVSFAFRALQSSMWGRTELLIWYSPQYSIALINEVMSCRTNIAPR